MGKKGNKTIRIDLHTLHTVDVSSFDQFDISSYGNKHIAVKYLPQNTSGRYYQQSAKVQTVYITDSTGNITDSAVKNDERPYRYAFTSGGKIIKYPVDAMQLLPVYVMDNLKNEEKKIPYSGTGELCDKKALLLKCFNEHSECGLVSATDFSVVVPFGKYGRLYTYPETIASTDPAGKPLDVLLIESEMQMHGRIPDPMQMMKSLVEGNQMPDGRKTIGYYTATGKKCWKD